MRQIYGQINSIGDTYAKKEIKELIEKNIIRRAGKGKDTYYILVTEWQPIFKEITGGFAVVLRKIQVPENLESLELSERQRKAIEYLKIHKNITRKIYIKINNISRR